ncbi:DUF1214 domain-containing protein [Fulvivirga sp. 1062]|uniref:DUF1214 domain-containing protein n=2 Tax=Fulvivirga sedimenti TaxID=2879465 RepID=A0A9X1KYX2_9BACT|nr:DUF1214 domain-containing protein [Fulvivirga sedimenti]
MRGLLFAFLKISEFFRKVRLSISGKTEDDIHDERVVSGKSWDEFCDQLKLAGSTLHLPGTPQNPFNQAEGLRYLTRLTRAGLEAFVEYADPAFPVFKRMVHETVKMGADNPDNYYFNAQISGDFEYVIRGKRNSVHYIGFFTQNGNYGTTGGLAPCGVLEGSDLIVEEDGSFEISVCRERKGSNWLKIEPETSMVMVRQTFLNRFEETPAEVHIENTDGRTAPSALTPKMIDEGLKMASMFIAGAPVLFARWAKGFQKHPNKLPLFDPEVSNAAGGDANITYYHSYWSLKEDEALVITVMPPECDSWNFQLNNYWMESLDYRYFTICVSKGNATYEPDGSLRVIVAHQDPGLPNWINTCEHSEGTMCWRWYRLKDQNDAVEPHCEVVKFDTLLV